VWSEKKKREKEGDQGSSEREGPDKDVFKRLREKIRRNRGGSVEESDAKNQLCRKP